MFYLILDTSCCTMLGLRAFCSAEEVRGKITEVMRLAAHLHRGQDKCLHMVAGLLNDTTNKTNVSGASELHQAERKRCE